MRMNFEIELYTHNLAFIKVKGVRRGHVSKIAQNPSEKRWCGRLEGKTSELKIVGQELDNLHYDSIFYKHSAPVAERPSNINLYC